MSKNTLFISKVGLLSKIVRISSTIDRSYEMCKSLCMNGDWEAAKSLLLTK